MVKWSVNMQGKKEEEKTEKKECELICRTTSGFIKIDAIETFFGKKNKNGFHHITFFKSYSEDFYSLLFLQLSISLSLSLSHPYKHTYACYFILFANSHWFTWQKICVIFRIKCCLSGQKFNYVKWNANISIPIIEQGLQNEKTLKLLQTCSPISQYESQLSLSILAFPRRNILHIYTGKRKNIDMSSVVENQIKRADNSSSSFN